MSDVRAWREPEGSLSRRLEGFSEELRLRAGRVTALCGGGWPEASDERHLRAALRELRDQYDELVAVEDELRAQVETSSSLAERAFAERDEALGLFEWAPDAALETDAGGVIRNANRRARDLFGRGVGASPPGRGPLRGKALTLLIDERSRRAVRDVLRLLDRVEEAGVQIMLTMPRTQPVRLAARVARAGDDRLLWTLRREPPAPEASRDEHVPRTTADLERKLADLEEVAARDRALLREAERRGHAKDRFLAILSHDLRGPINAVLGWTELLRRERLDANGRERAINIIERSTRFQLAMVNELLDVSRLLADKLRVEIAAIDLGAVVRRVCEGLLPTAEATGLTLSFPSDPSPWPVYGDSSRVEQIVSNLVSNALAFTPSGGAVEITLVRTEDGRVRLRVSDDGRGISPERLPTLFDGFDHHPGQDGQPTSRSGLRLGLFIVRQLVELHDGSVEVESDGEGRGAAFSVYLPMREPGIPDSSNSQRELPDLGETLDGLRLLLVDDDEDTRELLSTLFRLHGADVVVAKDVPSAIDLFERRPIDLLISDIALPGDSGHALLTRLRECRPDLRGIAISGFASRADADTAHAAGFDSFVTKPVSAERLLTEIRKLMPSRT